MKLPIPIVYAAERYAWAKMHVDLSLAFRESIPKDERSSDHDANRTLIALAVVMGHASGHPMTGTEIATCVGMPRPSVSRRLTTLINRNVITRVGGRYYLHPHRAAHPPVHMDRFRLIITQAHEALHATEMDE